MADDIRIELNDEGIQAILKGAEVKADLRRRADKVAAAAGPGMTVFEDVTTERARAGVFTESFQARYHEARNRALTKALDAAR